MRGAYLRANKLADSRGQRGGVRTSEGEEYELEIGFESHASPEMLALCQLHDEIIEFLETSRSHLGALVLKEYRNCVFELKRQLSESREVPK